jgi:hypothetical protein
MYRSNPTTTGGVAIPANIKVLRIDLPGIVPRPIDAPSGIPRTQLITTAELETINDCVTMGQISLISVCIGLSPAVVVIAAEIVGNRFSEKRRGTECASTEILAQIA